MKIFSGLLALGLLLAAGCASDEYDFPPPKVTLTMNEANSPIRLRVGEYALISLKENPTTGYVWYFKASPTPETPKRKTAEAVELVGERYVAPANRNGMVGVGGIKEVMVRAERPGRAYVLGACRRGWESEKPVAEVKFIFDVY